MESTGTKRPAEADQPVDTYAVCTSCSRLSADLHVCDKCGTALSDDNAAQCYSADPKRPCLDTSQVNGTSSPAPASSSSTSTGTGTTAAAASSPSSASVASSDTCVRPQTLYVNVNNQAFPVLGVGPAQATAGTISTSRVANTGTVYQNGSVVTSGVPAINGRVPSSNSRPIRSSPNSTLPNASVPVTMLRSTAGSTDSRSQSSASSYSRPVTVGSNMTAAITLPTYNLQPPPPPFAASVARLPGVVSATSQAPILTAPVGPSSGSSVPTVQVNAVQIRIGSKKFKPLSAVAFKDDGILFTLRDYTYAPVLLNARAILKCKANLNTFSYPVLFLFLENSCMRQIRNIFGLSSNDFCPNSPVEIRRCISIFPVFGVEGKSQAQSTMYNIRRSFEAMVRRYPRSASILEEITNDQVVDMLLDLNASDAVPEVNGATDSAAVADGVTAPNATTSSPATPAVTTASAPSTAAAVTAPSALTTALSQARVANGSLQQSSATTTTASSQSQPTSSANRGAGTQGAGTSITAQLNRAQAAAPVLQIPADQSRWQMMQKGLIAGGVYHVLMPDGGRQYCLWNGKQLVPCLVQNTEVQLTCVRVRIGSLLAHCVGQVRVRADQNSGIFFTLKSDHTGTQEVAITPDDLSYSSVCFSNHVSVIIITLNNVGADKLRKRLKLGVANDPAYDPAGSAIFRRHILLFLNGVNHDQEDALKQMKRPGSSTPMFEAIDSLKGMTLLAQIKLDTTNTGAVREFLLTKQMSGALGLEKLINDVASSTSGGAVVEDDDDDVIMTQEEVGMKCPYTQQVMKWPVRNNICGHNYERDAIQEFIQRKKGNAKCPYAGCANLVALRMEDLVENTQLREYIGKHNAGMQKT